MKSTLNSPKKQTELRGQVVVITGASSGIGRATALAFAHAGARVVLAARNREALENVAAECTAAGVQVLSFPVDVSDELAVVNLARAVQDAYSHIDVWINNAGVGLFGPFTEADMEAHRRVIETNLLAAMNGAAAVLPYFLRQRRGILITNISVGGFAPVPFATAYTASKFGMRGFMAALRQELVNAPGIRICSVFPSMIDTPGFQHGANVSGVAVRPAPPIYRPEAVAAAMVSLALKPRDELPVGLPARVAKLSYGLMPLTTERVIGGAFRRYLKSGEPAPRDLGNLLQPSTPPHSSEGGWKLQRHIQTPSHSKLLWAGLGGAAAAGIALLFGTKFRST